MTEIYPLREFEGVSLAIMPRPRAGDWLADEIDSWRNANIRTVVSLLESREIAELGLEDEAQLCASRGVQFVSFPIRDRGVPISYGALNQLIVPLLSKVRGGLMVAVHCRAGIGRSGLVAASILVRSGIPYAHVFPALSRARGLAVPDTEAQAEWVRGYAQCAL
jgi:polymorphic toxin system DSP-PTPase phosphatase-like protein